MKKSMASMPEQGILPTMDGPVLVLGPVLVCFELEGSPVGKGRPRFNIIQPRSGGRPFANVYTPPETRAYESDLSKAAKEAYGRGRWPSDKPIQLLVHAFMPIPISWSEKDHRAALIGAKAHTKTPDGDNILKCVGDALNDIIWLDDSQIIDARVIKRYSEIPALRIEAREFIIPCTPTPSLAP